jgi:hypothetical protein
MPTQSADAALLARDSGLAAADEVADDRVGSTPLRMPRTTAFEVKPALFADVRAWRYSPGMKSAAGGGVARAERSRGCASRRR